MKRVWTSALSLCMALCAFACSGSQTSEYEGTQIVLSDDGIRVDGAKISSDETQPVYVGNDIVYYEAGRDFTYGEGTEAEAHSRAEAEAHTVVHIAEPGTYVLSGSLSLGQIAVDLGEEAKTDPEAVVTLILNGADLTCTVAPAIIFYRVYECGNTDADAAGPNVDTKDAGANVLIGDGTENVIRGSHVARIYRPDTVVLNEDGTEVSDAKKLHKYDGAFYSRMSMNVGGGEKGDGLLRIYADNEGMDSELHLTINGGNIEIVSGNDGINTNEDNVSVTTINGGSLQIRVDGATGEGDGIDSNGWLVINGGSVIAQACAVSGDAGIDSDCGIHIHGGTVFASGNLLDRIGDSDQMYAVFQFSESQTEGTYRLCNALGFGVLGQEIENRFTCLIVSSPKLREGNYGLRKGLTAYPGYAEDGRNGSMKGMTPPEGMAGRTPPEGMEGRTPPEGMEGMMPPEGMEGMTPPEGMEGMTPPEGMEGMTPPEGMEGRPNRSERREPAAGEATKMFALTDGGNYFVVVQPE